MHLEQLALVDQVADGDRLAPERLGLATAGGLVFVSLQLDELGEAGDQPGDFLGLISGQPLVREGDSVRRLSVNIGQRQASGIDDPIPTGDWLKSPWAREAALRHGREDKLRRRCRRMQTRRI